jgi:hypothetical protein
MKTIANSARGAALLGAAFVLSALTASAADTGMDKMDMSMPMPATPTAAKPKNLGEALASLHKSYALFTSLIKANRQAEVHMESDQVIAAAKALVTFANELPSDKRGRLTGAVDNLVKAVNALHDAAHTGNREATDKAMTATDGVLKVIDALVAPASPAGK